ncbi:MAG: HU-CCDC81 and SPOR domain-containing protein [Flavobacteriales bacterium]|nr:HU-CCDC81 and SPOR domain-containing protein [Flavobacteriales bacterium]
MKQTIEHYISNLLFLHDCVIIPEFGGFVGNKKSAYIHPVSGIIYPPSKELLFNKNLTKNDGLLATYIARMEGIDLSETSILIENFVQNVQTELDQRNAFKLQKIGTFTKGIEGNISFLQNKNYNYNLASFGLQANHKSKKVERTISEDKKVIIKNIKQKDLGKTLTRAAAVLIPLIGLSLIGITQEENINRVYSQMANLNPFANTKTEIVVEIPTKKVVEPIVEIPAEVIIPKTEEEIIPNIKQQQTYYIIAGAFSEKNNADKMLTKLNKWNYNAEIVKGGNLIRVSYDSFNNREEAVLALNKIKQDNPSAWLLAK